MGFFGGPPIDPLEQDPFGGFNPIGGGFDVIGFVEAVLSAILELLAQLASLILAVLKSIGDFFAHLWNNFFKGLFRGLLDKLKKSGLWNDLKHGHILKFLHDLRVAVRRTRSVSMSIRLSTKACRLSGTSTAATAASSNGSTSCSRR